MLGARTICAKVSKLVECRNKPRKAIIALKAASLHYKKSNRCRSGYQAAVGDQLCTACLDLVIRRSDCAVTTCAVNIHAAVSVAAVKMLQASDSTSFEGKRVNGVPYILSSTLSSASSASADAWAAVSERCWYLRACPVNAPPRAQCLNKQVAIMRVQTLFAHVTVDPARFLRARPFETF